MNHELVLPDEMLADLFNPERMPARKDGWVSHPDADFIYDQLGIDDEGEAAWQYIKNLGYEYCTVLLDDDFPVLAEAYFLGGSNDCSAWIPTAPKGKGWFLAWITDSEEGPAAVYVRRAE